MAALHDLDDETRTDLARTRSQHAELTSRMTSLRRAGEPADSPWLRKLGWQLDACRQWITRYEAALVTAHATRLSDGGQVGTITIQETP